MSNSGDILVVEDSPTQAERLAFLLEEHGYSVTVAGNGADALAAARERRPALILSDVLMPEMDGFELCQTVKHDETLREVPVVLITALSDPEDILRGLKAGADYYLTKPYDDSYLVSKIGAVLARPVASGGTESEDEMEIIIGGERHTIRTSRQRIVKMFLATYENVVRQNSELVRMQSELSALNEQLESKVAERTAELRAKNEEVSVMSQHLLQTAKLATMGELAASIAHEVNNPLATISVRVGSLLMDLPDDAPERRELEIIEHEVERVGKLVDNLLHFSHQRQYLPSTVNVCEEIDNMLELIYYHLRNHGVSVERDESPGTALVDGDQQQLQQLLLNLFTNAVDAMPQGGTLTISVKVENQEMLGRSPAPGQPGLREPAFVVIDISDTGVGISPEILPRVTEPFFTTKPDGKGTGLGLSICRRIVQDHSGSMQITSQVGKGSSFHIVLPVRPDPHSPRHMADAGGGEHAFAGSEAGAQGEGWGEGRYGE